MTDETVPHIRQRINIGQTAKGLHQVEVTVELVEPLVNGKSTESSKLAQDALNLLKDVEEALKKDGRNLVTSEVK